MVRQVYPNTPWNDSDRYARVVVGATCPGGASEQDLGGEADDLSTARGLAGHHHGPIRHRAELKGPAKGAQSGQCSRSPVVDDLHLGLGNPWLGDEELGERDIDDDMALRKSGPSRDRIL